MSTNQWTTYHLYLTPTALSSPSFTNRSFGKGLGGGIYFDRMASQLSRPFTVNDLVYPPLRDEDLTVRFPGNTANSPRTQMMR